MSTNKPKFNPNQSFEVEKTAGKPKFNPSQSFSEEIPSEMGVGEELARGTINSLPMLGGLIGGASSLLGGPTAPLTVAGLSAGGAATGAALQRGLNTYFYPDEAAKVAQEQQGMNELEKVANNLKQPAFEAGMAIAGEGVGAGMAKAGNAVLKKLSASSLADWAEKAAARTIGLDKGLKKKIIQKDGIEKINELGRQALDEKLFGKTTSVTDMFENNATLKDAGILEKNKFIDAIEASGKSTYNPSKVASEHASTFKRPSDYEASADSAAAYDSILRDLKKVSGYNDRLPTTVYGDYTKANSSLKDANELLQAFGDKGNFLATTKTPSAKEYTKAYATLAPAIDKAGVESAMLAGLDAKSLADINRKTSNRITIENLLNNAVSKDANRYLNLNTAVMTAPSFAVGDFGTAAANMGLLKTADMFGNQNMALGLDALAKSKLMKSNLVKPNFTKEGQKVLPYLMMQLSDDKK